MRAVLYTRDLEPITVIELENYAVDYLLKFGVVKLVVSTPLKLVLCEKETPINEPLKIVSISAEPFYYRSARSVMLFTDDEESALLLKSVFLPGQESTIQQRDRDNFAKGFFKAISTLGY